MPYLVAVVSTEAGNQENPDNPVTAIVIATAVSAKDTITATIVAATTKQQKQNPDAAITSQDSVIVVVARIATAVSSS